MSKQDVSDIFFSVLLIMFKEVGFLLLLGLLSRRAIIFFSGLYYLKREGEDPLRLELLDFRRIFLFFGFCWETKSGEERRDVLLGCYRRMEKGVAVFSSPTIWIRKERMLFFFVFCLQTKCNFFSLLPWHSRCKEDVGQGYSSLVFIVKSKDWKGTLFDSLPWVLSSKEDGCVFVGSSGIILLTEKGTGRLFFFVWISSVKGRRWKVFFFFFIDFCNLKMKGVGISWLLISTKWRRRDGWVPFLIDSYSLKEKGGMSPCLFGFLLSSDIREVLHHWLFQ